MEFEINFQKDLNDFISYVCKCLGALNWDTYSMAWNDHKLLDDSGEVPISDEVVGS
jgi:hypothetical protein